MFRKLLKGWFRPRIFVYSVFDRVEQSLRFLLFQKVLDMILIALFYTKILTVKDTIYKWIFIYLHHIPINRAILKCVIMKQEFVI